MKEKLSIYLKKNLHKQGVYKQYINDVHNVNYYDDPLHEDEYEVCKGLVHKYANRALLKVNLLCAAHCQFCTRSRQIGQSFHLNEKDVSNIKSYLILHPEIQEVILSGGDPFMTPLLSIQILDMLRQAETIKVIRIGSRLALQAPESLYKKQMQRLLESIYAVNKKKPIYILLHINHADELTPETVAAINYLKEKTACMLFSQTVFLKNINDDYQTLYTLYNRLYQMGVIPYYIFHCDEVKGLEHFYGDIEKEAQIMQKLRQNLSGLAIPVFVVDAAEGKTVIHENNMMEYKKF